MALRPERYRSAVVPHIYIDGAAAAIDFYERALGAVELFRIARPDGRILHAELSICGSLVMLGDPDETLYGEPRKVGPCGDGAPRKCIAEVRMTGARPSGAGRRYPPTGRKVATWM